MAVGEAEVGTGDPGGGFADDYVTLYRPLVRYCRRITQVADPEDLAQEAMLRAWPSYTEGRDMWPLVVTIARRLAIDAHRRSRTGEVRSHLEAANRPTEAPSPEELVERREEARLARRALGQLSPRYQRMIQLRDIDERSYTDIAEMEGTSLDVARSTLRRARAALRAAYGRASEGVAAALGLERWLSRRSGRVQAALGPIANQGLPTLAGAVVVIAVAAGITGAPKGDTLKTVSPPSSGHAFQRGIGGSQRGGSDRAGGSARASTTSGTGHKAAASIAAPGPVRPDRVVGPVGIGGRDYVKDKTEDSEIKIEFEDPAGQVLVGIYASPKQFLEDPTAPLPPDE